MIHIPRFRLPPLLLMIGFVLNITPRSNAGPLLDQVNPLQGTDSNIGLSYGSTLPLVCTPWGMTNWSPQTNGGWGWWFSYNTQEIQGIRSTHQPSPWMGDYGQFLLMPQTGPVIVDREQRQSPYNRDQSIFRPDYLKLDLSRYNVGVELTASQRCAILRMTFRHTNTGRLIVDPAETSHLEITGRTVRGFTTAVSGGGAPANFKTFFIIQFDRNLTATGTFSGKTVHANETKIDGKNVGAYVEFSTAANSAVEARIATSFISLDQAQRNLQSETAAGFDAVRAQATNEWETNLSRMQVQGGTEAQRRTFYSCLYRAQIFPHRLYELDEKNQPIHYSPYDGKVHPGVLYGDNGFWDVYRTEYPFWSIVFPDQLGEMLQGFVNAYKENGWFPQWPSPGNRGGMIGTHIDAVIADAVAKHISGFDVQAAYEGIRKDAFVASTGWVGRGNLNEYLKLGYITGMKGYAMSATLDYAYDDWCLAQVALALGKQTDADALLKRAGNYRNLWDPNVGFFRCKNADGSWLTPFDQFAWGGGYVEGGPWQCSWAVQHDPMGLAQLMGGPAAMADKLDRMLGTAPIAHPGDYGYIIHEATEMSRQRFGQYDQSNQPSHHILYLYTVIGQPWKTQYWVRRVCQELYNPGPDGFPGDEDNGEMACWYLLSATGIYPLCPGKAEYVLASPLFDQITVRPPGGKQFVVKAEKNKPHNPYIQHRWLNGKEFASQTISHQAIADGGELRVELGERPPE